MAAADVFQANVFQSDVFQEGAAPVALKGTIRKRRRPFIVDIPDPVRIVDDTAEREAREAAFAAGLAAYVARTIDFRRNAEDEFVLGLTDDLAA
jgi:hypothetical protein